LVVNPGGPGVSGVDYLRSAAGAFPAAVRDRFDLVSFDPRGVGGSDPIVCTDSLDPLFDQSFSPADAGQRASLVQAFRDVATGCSRRNASLLGHVSTQDTARDLDRLRGALGDAKLTFVGGSYGTFLGNVYAALFPTHVRALVFDGGIDPSADAVDTNVVQARGFEQGLDDFLADCSRRSSCPFRLRRPRRRRVRRARRAGPA
jgi:pimeloyl-ACP methyl ester carboxylesterase